MRIDHDAWLNFCNNPSKETFLKWFDLLTTYEMWEAFGLAGKDVTDPWDRASFKTNEVFIIEFRQLVKDNSHSNLVPCKELYKANPNWLLAKYV